MVLAGSSISSVSKSLQAIYFVHSTESGEAVSPCFCKETQTKSLSSFFFINKALLSLSTTATAPLCSDRLLQPRRLPVSWCDFHQK